MTRDRQQIVPKSACQGESRWYIAGVGHGVQPGANCALHYLISG